MLGVVVTIRLIHLVVMVVVADIMQSFFWVQPWFFFFFFFLDGVLSAASTKSTNELGRIPPFLISRS